MHDYTLNRCSRRCHKADRLLEPGEGFVSAVIKQGSAFSRVDVSEQAWEGPPDGCLGWWKGRIPTHESKRRKLAPVHVLLETLSKLCESTDNASLAYLLALLLVRKRILIDEPVSNRERILNQLAPGSTTGLHLIYPVDGTEYLVPECAPEPDAIAELQQQLGDLLYCEEA